LNCVVAAELFEGLRRAFEGELSRLRGASGWAEDRLHQVAGNF